jgi:hypothetical protein
MADPRSSDLHDDLSRARRWLRNIRDLSGSTNASKPYRSHDEPPYVPSKARTVSTAPPSITNEALHGRSEDRQIDPVPPTNAEKDSIDVPLAKDPKVLRPPAVRSRQRAAERNVRALRPSARSCSDRIILGGRQQPLAVLASGSSSSDQLERMSKHQARMRGCCNRGAITNSTRRRHGELGGARRNRQLMELCGSP